MYPNLLVPLVTIVLLLVAVLGYVAVFRPVARRLAVRQVARRRNEAILAVTGATLGIAIIVGALVVGDTLNHSVRQVAYRTLGPVDERIMAADPGTGELAAKTLQPLRSDPRVDGVLTVHVDQAAATTESSSGVLAEPRVLAWGLDYAQAAQFGRAGGSSGLDVAPPAAGDAIVNQPLANSLHLRAGEKFTLYLYGTAHTYRIARIVADRGLAGVGFGSARNHNVFLPPGALDLAAYKADTRPQTVSFVSNRGGVESGASLTTPVTARIDQLLTGLPVIVDTPKRVVLDDARKTGDALGALFLMIGSFSIIAGALLLVNIFTMLADERQSQLGMLRAIGMKRAQLVQSFTFEGATYAAAAVVPGIALGLGIGWAVALVSAQIFKSWSPDGNGLAISYAVTPTSIVNATCLGLVIALITIAAASVRISRFNVIAAIRDLPPSTLARTRKRRVIVATGFAVLFAVAAVPAVAASNGNLTLLLPALAIGLLIPALQRFLTPRAAITSAATAILAWSAVAPVLRPRMFDNPSMAIYVIQGSLIAFSGVAVISQNQHAIVRPLRRLIERPTERGLAMRLGVAYPLAKRFRTGATLIMYTLITLVLVLLIEITGVINKSIDTNVANATAGYALRLDVNPTATGATLADLRHGPFAADVAAVAPLVSAPALATDPGHRTSALLRAIAVGVPAGSMDAMTMTSRLPGLATDRQAWQLVQSDPKYVLLDQFFNATGGPNGKFYSPGDTLTLTNPRTGESA
ncbi:MAG TPA: FtsX-like permease family protein, partial [Jatrophihabitantaceae bacterium]|nr:FtsX-like permease family protein [Jatrophihabitantaceae bacterium]